MATVIKPAAAPTPDTIDAKVAASNQAAADAVAKPEVDATVTPPAPPATDDLVAVAKAARQNQGFPPQAAQSIAETDAKADGGPMPLHEQMGRDLEPDPRGIVEGAFKVDQAGSHISEASPAEIVADETPEQTTAKGLSPDGTGSNGMVPGDAIPT